MWVNQRHSINILMLISKRSSFFLSMNPTFDESVSNETKICLNPSKTHCLLATLGLIWFFEHSFKRDSNSWPQKSTSRASAFTTFSLQTFVWRRRSLRPTEGLDLKIRDLWCRKESVGKEKKEKSSLGFLGHPQLIKDVPWPGANSSNTWKNLQLFCPILS